jgi:hypothetical protein
MTKLKSFRENTEYIYFCTIFEEQITKHKNHKLDIFHYITIQNIWLCYGISIRIQGTAQHYL